MSHNEPNHPKRAQKTPKMHQNKPKGQKKTQNVPKPPKKQAKTSHKGTYNEPKWDLKWCKTTTYKKLHNNPKQAKTTQGEQRGPKTSQKETKNVPKPPKTNLNKPKNLQIDPKSPEISKLGRSRIFCQLLFFTLWAHMPKFGYFGSISINFLILTKFCMYPISKVLISNLTLVFENFGLKCPNLGIFGQKL